MNDPLEALLVHDAALVSRADLAEAERDDLLELVEALRADLAEVERRKPPRNDVALLRRRIRDAEEERDAALKQAARYRRLLRRIGTMIGQIEQRQQP